MGKFTKKLKKFAKKAAPLAMLGLGAAALAKRRKAKALNAITDYGDTGPLSGKAGYEGDVPSAPKVDNIVPKKKPLYAKNMTANPNAIPHEVVFNARHGIGITKDKDWVDAKGSRDGLMEFMAQKEKENWLTKQKVLNNARTDYSVSGFKRDGGRIGHKSGGRVKGAGCAKRGFGRALKKK